MSLYDSLTIKMVYTTVEKKISEKCLQDNIFLQTQHLFWLRT